MVSESATERASVNANANGNANASDCHATATRTRRRTQVPTLAKWGIYYSTMIEDCPAPPCCCCCCCCALAGGGDEILQSDVEFYLILCQDSQGILLFCLHSRHIFASGFAEPKYHTKNLHHTKNERSHSKFLN